MNIFQQLTEKPWIAVEGPTAEGRLSSLPTAKIGLRTFLIVVTVLFSILTVAYTERMELGDWVPVPEPWLLWLNTAVLVMSSVALQRAWTSARRGQTDGLKTGLLVGGLLAAAFLVGQLLVWRQLADLGFYASANPAAGFFYLITTLHGLHMLGGLLVLGITTDKVLRGVEVEKIRLSVELCAIYWHFLLMVWLVLFGLLLFT